uniref:Uncharacterized protein n=1 Tax=Glossina brevipalpis TaxID=37001 RepID=A0A1A9WFI6_9MUSC
MSFHLRLRVSYEEWFLVVILNGFSKPFRHEWTQLEFRTIFQLLQNSPKAVFNYTYNYNSIELLVVVVVAVMLLNEDFPVVVVTDSGRVTIESFALKLMFNLNLITAAPVTVGVVAVWENMFNNEKAELYSSCRSSQVWLEHSTCHFRRIPPKTPVLDYDESDVKTEI